MERIQGNSDYNNPIFNTPNSVTKPKFIAHRGYTPLAPENSIPAFEAAGKLGYWAIETDVYKTVDDVLVCCHDSTIDRTFNGTGSISSMTYEQLMQCTMDTGNQIADYTAEQLKIPTFKQYLKICRYYGCVPFIEIKTDIAEHLVPVLREYGLEPHSVISSSSFSHIAKVRDYSHQIFVHHIFSSMEKLEEVAGLGNAGLALNYTDMALVSEADIKLLHARGLKVCFRAGDTEEQAQAMIDIGADYLPTNTMYRLTVE
ncbi:glycerophosphodiester phosphodiesterase [Paenibacillus sp. FSL H8-0034]|uniref:glycerophosphodiester phosphodiesterase n=1 Tax=Paenibacillus sp. FSL H8-0034 TaxID=2954671 RepID=UPI0030F979A1